MSRTSAKVRERTRPDRLRKDYRDFLLWLHANVLDSAIERLFFVPTKGSVPLDGLKVVGNNRGSGHAYKPSPALVFKWALAAVAEEDIGRMSFVDYGAGKGRVMLLAAQHPFTPGRRHRIRRGAARQRGDEHRAVSAEPDEVPQCRVRARRRGQHHAGRRRGGALFLQPVRAAIFAEVLKGIVASYHARPRRLYVILIDMDAAELMHKTGVFQEMKLPSAERIQVQALSPYKISVFRSLA